MNKNFFYVDTFDFSRESSGNGGATINNAVIRHLPDKACFIGYTSDDDVPGKLTTKTLFGRTIDVIPVANFSKSGAAKRSLMPGAIRFFRYLQRSRKAWNALGIRKVFTGNYIVLWYFAFLTDYQIAYYATGLGNPWLIGRHPWAGKYFSKLYDFIQSRALRRAQITWAADSPETCAEWNRIAARHGTKITFEAIPSVVDTDFFRPLDRAECRGRWNLPAEAPVYIFVGRLAQVKGVDLILNAFRLVLKKRPDAMLLLVGDGEEKASLQTLAESLNVSARVRFTGRRNPEEIVSLLGAADASVVGSHVEGSSFAMVEQLAAGKAMISTVVSGADDFIRDGVNGFVVRTRAPELYAEKMLAVLDLPEAERCSRNLALEKYSENGMWETLRKRLLEWK